MKDRLPVLAKGLRCLVLVVSMRRAVLAQTVQSTTALTANSPSLVLPGTLTLTSAVNNPPAPGGVPTGSVTFAFDGTNSLGSAPLKMIPSTQSFPNAPTVVVNTASTNPVGLLAVDLFGTGKPALVTGNNASGAYSVTVLPTLGAGTFNSTNVLSTPIGGFNPIDGMATGFFLSKTQKSALVHAPFSYNVISVASNALITTTSNAGSTSSSSADAERMVIEDFDGDGYSDIGVLLVGSEFQSPVVGIALNQGASAPGSFAPLVQVVLPTTQPDGAAGTFCADAMAAGTFSSGSSPQLAVLGHFGAAPSTANANDSPCFAAPPAGTASYVVLIAYPTAMPTFSPADFTDFQASESVTIADATPAAAIYYTTDGSTPTTSSSVYSGAITLTATTVINAIAIAPGYSPSTVATSEYELQAAAPQLPPSGNYTVGDTITISDNTPNAIVFYNTDDGIYVQYTAPVALTAAGTITFTAFADATGYGQSPIVSETYTVANQIIQIQRSVTGKNQANQAASGARSITRANPNRTASIKPRLSPAVSPLIAVGTDQTAIASSDFNQDSNADLILGSSTGQLQLYYGKGDGTFNAAAAANTTNGTPLLLDIDDFNGDGYPDVAVTLNAGGGLAILLNDGKGNLKSTTQQFNAGAPVAITSGDFNADGLSDLALLQFAPTTGVVSIDTFLSQESAQATLVTPAKSLPAGMHTLTASFPGDANFQPSTSAALTETVAQGVPVITWSNPAPIVYGTPITAAQLDASATTPGMFAYTTALNAILPPGTQTLNATFTPADIFDYAGATAQASLQVDLPAVSLTGISPASAPLGSQPVTIAIAGLGFENDAIVQWKGASLATTYVGPDSLTAVIPASDLNAAGVSSVTVYNPTSLQTSGSRNFTVLPPQAVTTVTVPPAADPGSQPSIALTLNPYPAPVTVTMTLGFMDSSSSPTSTNGSVNFVTVPSTDVVTTSASGQPIDTFTIPANTTAAIPSRIISAGDVQGAITVTITLSAGGVDITPSTLAVSQVAVAASVPVIQSAVFNASGDTLQVVVIASSSTREVSAASFHFTPVTGKTLTTTDLTLTKPAAFPAWFSDAQSAQYGSAFTYTQSFTLNADASVVDSVTVTLENGQGSSTATNAQSK